MNRSAGGAAPRSMIQRPTRLVVLSITAALLVTAAIGVPLPVGEVPTDHVHLVDLSRSCGADTSRLIDALGARILTGDSDDRIAIVGFGTSALTLASPRPADDPESALDAARARLATLSLRERSGSRVSAGIARALTLVGDPERRLVVILWGDLRHPPGTLDRLRRMLPPTARFDVRGRLTDPEPDVRLGMAGAAPSVVTGVPTVVRVRVHLQDDRPRTVTVSAAGRPFAVRLRPGRSKVLAVTVRPEKGERTVSVTVSDPGGPDSDDLNNVVSLPVSAGDKTSVLVIGQGAIDLSPEAYHVVRPGAPGPAPEADVIVLADQPATDEFRAAWTGLIRRRVVSLGVGLVVLGGPHAFRSGGYGGWDLDTLLPLSSRSPRGRDVHVLLDRSGSMEQHDRLTRAVEALRQLAKGLSPVDRLQVWPFGVEPLPPVPPVATAPVAFLADGLPDLWRLVPAGGTRVLGSLDGPARAAAAVGDEREAILVVLSDLKDEGLDAPALAVISGQVAAFSGGAVALLLDPTPKTTRTARDAGLRAVPVRELTPDLFLAQVEEDGWKTAPLDTTWVDAPAGRPDASSIRAWNPVLRGDGARVLLRTVTGQPILGEVRRGAGRVMALATDPSLEGWTNGLAQLLVDTVAPPDDAGWSARASAAGLTVRSAPGVTGPLSLRSFGTAGAMVDGGLTEVAPGIWRADIDPGSAATTVLCVYGASGELLARPSLSLADDPEYLLAPLPPLGPDSWPEPRPPARVRWPPGLLALILMVALILLRDR